MAKARNHRAFGECLANRGSVLIVPAAGAVTRRGFNPGWRGALRWCGAERRLSLLLHLLHLLLPLLLHLLLLHLHLHLHLLLPLHLLLLLRLHLLLPLLLHLHLLHLLLLTLLFLFQLTLLHLLCLLLLLLKLALLNLLLIGLLWRLCRLLCTVEITRRHVVFRALKPRWLGVAVGCWRIGRRCALYLRHLWQGRCGSITGACGIITATRYVADARRRDRSPRSYAAAGHVATLRMCEPRRRQLTPTVLNQIIRHATVLPRASLGGRVVLIGSRRRGSVLSRG